MPLYEYQCEACGKRFEVIQKKYSDAPVETCTKCGKGPVRQLLSSPAIQFKGSGWYITDYAKKGRGSESSEAGTSEAGKTDAKKSETTTTTTDASTKSDTSSSAPVSTSTPSKD